VTSPWEARSLAQENRRQAEVAGVPAEYRLAARRYLGEEAAAAYLAQIDQPVTTMIRIAVRSTWVGVLDFQQRLPDVMGGPTG
jgi:hypothetical protein